jgi:5-methyltetrahydropteroyltriglutamate--homocysteine methyltransferase
MMYPDAPESAFLERVERHVAVINQALRHIPPERVRLHLCWGNYEGPHTRDIPLERVLPLLRRLRIGALAFEAANPRHAHEWAVWRDTPPPQDWVLIPGCLDTRTNVVEHPELVAQRLEAFARIVGPERVIAGTDCGFGTFAGVGRVNEDVVWAKLAALAEGARIASARL